MQLDTAMGHLQCTVREDGRLLVAGSGWQCSYSNVDHNLFDKLKQHNGLGSMTHLKFNEW